MGTLAPYPFCAAWLQRLPAPALWPGRLVVMGKAEEPAKYHKMRLEPRVRRVGRFLRRASPDELPPVWNVLRGNRHA